MPHLSPMNWIMALLMFWLILMIVTSKSWWMHISSMPFNLPSNKFMNKVQSQWKWNW